MIKLMLEGPSGGFTFHHVRMGFSSDMDDVGRVHLRKIRELLSVIIRVIIARFRTGANILYYPPAGPNRVPFYRDAAVLCATRWLFAKTIFHFHASGISLLWPRLRFWERWLFRAAYDRPDLSIRTSSLNPDDGAFLRARHSVVVPNGLPDAAAGFHRPASNDQPEIRLLFVGALYEEKGVFDLIEACRILAQRQIAFCLDMVGRVESPEIACRLDAALRESALSDQVKLHGVKTGGDKWALYRQAAIFVNPTWFHAESFSLVNVEAMMFSLPVVSTNWRGIPEVVLDGKTGLLVPPHSPEALADAILTLARNPALRHSLGQAGRTRYEQLYSAQAFHRNLQQAFSLALSA